MFGKHICKQLADIGIQISVPNLYERLCEWGYMERKNTAGHYECKHTPLNTGITIVKDPGNPYERPEFSVEVAVEIIDKFSSAHQSITYSDRNMEDIKKIIDNENAILTPQDSNALKWLRADFRKHYNTSIHHYYINSNRWQIRRKKIFDSLGEKCYRCSWTPPIYPKLSANRINVHHLTYMNWVDELSEELVPLCTRCHEWIHAAWDKIPRLSPYKKHFTDELRQIKKEIILSNIILTPEDL